MFVDSSFSGSAFSSTGSDAAAFAAFWSSDGTSVASRSIIGGRVAFLRGEVRELRDRVVRGFAGFSGLSDVATPNFPETATLRSARRIDHRIIYRTCRLATPARALGQQVADRYP